MANAVENSQSHNYPTRTSTRRKSLFPDSDADSDLGRISPLSTDTVVNAAEPPTRESRFLKSSWDDYIVLGNVSCTGTFDSDPGSESTLSTLCLSPIRHVTSSPVPQSPEQLTKILTPIADSPSSNMKTPHDTTVKQNTKQNKRKLFDENAAIDSPECKVSKTDHKNSKARTSLFGNDEHVEISLPAKSFYPKTEEVVRRPIVFDAPKPRPVQRRANNARIRARGKRRFFGQINAGVQHKIKKPKQKKISTGAILKAAIKIIEKSPLNEYLEEMVQFSKKTIKPLPPPKTIPSNDKENVPCNSQDGIKEKKFFTSSRASHKKPESPQKRKLDDSCGFDNTSIEAPSVIEDIITYLDHEEENVEAMKPELMLSPTSQMCDMASVLDLNSPKRAKLNITNILESAENKLFPVFYGSNGECAKKSTKVQHQPSAKRFKATGADQMLIDAGQKKFGATECSSCHFIYEIGDAGDEAAHQKYHNSGNLFKYNGWKNERIVYQSGFDVKILKIIPGDMKSWWNKVNELLSFVNNELGSFNTDKSIEKSQVYLYIKNKQIVGLLVAELKTKAYKLLNDDEVGNLLCSEESYPVRCGVLRLWVTENHRKCGIATEMMNSLKRNFLYGYFLKSDEIAMSSSTDSGRLFAERYFANKNFLIYTE